MTPLRSVLLCGFACLTSVLWADGEQQFAKIGDLRLQSGEVLQNCRVGYRTFGTLSAKKDNVVLVPTWYLGTTKDLAGSFRPGGMVDTSRFYVIAVDALTDGVSSSPSNSPEQPGDRFPTVTIRDMVESQHSMLLQLGIGHLRGVVGISMGGMQTFQWVTAYPDFVDRAVPIVGSPQASAYDLMDYHSGWKAVREAIDNPASRKGIITAFADYFWLSLNTPEYYVQHTKRSEAIDSLQGFEKAIFAWNLYDVLTGMSALEHQDIYGPFGGDAVKAAAAVKAKLFVIASAQDHCSPPLH